MPHMKTPAITPRNIVDLIGTLIERKLRYEQMCEDRLSFHDSRQDAFDNVIEAENKLCAALEEVLKR